MNERRFPKEVSDEMHTAFGELFYIKRDTLLAMVREGDTSDPSGGSGDLTLVDAAQIAMRNGHDNLDGMIDRAIGKFALDALRARMCIRR